MKIACGNEVERTFRVGISAYKSRWGTAGEQPLLGGW